MPPSCRHNVLCHSSFRLLSLPLEVFSEGLWTHRITLPWLPASTLGFHLKLTLYPFDIQLFEFLAIESTLAVSSLPCISYFHLLFQRQEGGVLFFTGGEGVSLLTYYFLFRISPFYIRTYPPHILLFRLRLIPVITLYPHTTVLLID